MTTNGALPYTGNRDEQRLKSMTAVSKSDVREGSELSLLRSRDPQPKTSAARPALLTEPQPRKSMVIVLPVLEETKRSTDGIESIVLHNRIYVCRESWHAGKIQVVLLVLENDWCDPGTHLSLLLLVLQLPSAGTLQCRHVAVSASLQLTFLAHTFVSLSVTDRVVVDSVFRCCGKKVHTPRNISEAMQTIGIENNDSFQWFWKWSFKRWDLNTISQAEFSFRAHFVLVRGDFCFCLVFSR